MAVTPVWKLWVLRFLGDAEAWLRNLFLTPARRADRYRQIVAEEAFETWMGFGSDFERVLTDRIAATERSGPAGNIKFWRDVLASAKDFDSYPDNKRKRDEQKLDGINSLDASAACPLEVL